MSLWKLLPLDNNCSSNKLLSFTSLTLFDFWSSKFSTTLTYFKTWWWRWSRPQEVQYCVHLWEVLENCSCLKRRKMWGNTRAAFFWPRMGSLYALVECCQISREKQNQNTVRLWKTNKRPKTDEFTDLNVCERCRGIRLCLCVWSTVLKSDHPLSDKMCLFYSNDSFRVHVNH